MIFNRTRDINAGINDINHTVTIAIRRRGVGGDWTPLIFDRAGYGRALILRVRHFIAVFIGTAIGVGRTGVQGASVLGIGDFVAILIEGRGETGHLRIALGEGYHRIIIGFDFIEEDGAVFDELIVGDVEQDALADGHRDRFLTGQLEMTIVIRTSEAGQRQLIGIIGNG